ncbi:aminotransferase class V-fold PLP-dependent enzyme [Microaceticoccus formicicus]|uniref:aminotransferase class V-fold PLP-dependent enzyme n=1 Tax=Microaceticoccus formicicus TaxID=3118105 RepID=UPI003CD02B0E|nr:aminotransferase class V-fold PLP-dependent enzyme [Peptoniphilaceae bacterium AMB_02]
MIYFDNAATTFPKPTVVTDKLLEVVTGYCANPGRSGHKFALKMDREIFDVRDRLTKFVNGTNTMNTIFTFNGTDSLNIAIKGVVKEGMHVITTSMEHNSVLRPLKELERRALIELTIVEGNQQGMVEPEDIEKSIKPNTGIIVTTHMSNLTGTILDIEKIGQIAANYNIIYIVDAAQSIGVLDIDVQKMNIDILCFPGHKGLLGPMGTGGLYIREGLELDHIKEGGTGSFSSDPLQPSIYPDRLECGTSNGPGIIALGEGLKFIEEVGLENIREHEESLKNLFIENILDDKDFKLYGTLDNRQGAVVSLNLKDMDSSELGYILSEDYEIFIRPGLHCAPLAHKSIGTTDFGAARFSFGYFNTDKEVLEAVRILKEIAKEY